MDDLSRQYYCRNLKVIQEFRKTLLDCLSVVDGTKLNLEKTGDGCYTCQFEKPSGGQIYLYSKFKPLEIARKAISKYPLIGQKNFLVLGLGLGYELAELHRLSGELFEQIIVIENKAELFYLFLHTGDYSDILSDPRITFLIGSASELVLPTNSLTVIENANLTVLAPGYYQKIVAEINFFLKKNTANRVIVFDHVTFADDVSQALKHLSFEVSKMKLIPDLDAMAAQIKEGTPRFLFSINLNPSILRIANHLGIPYISWTVDTPSANLFHDDNKSPYAMLFIYERESVKRLRQDGFQNVYYLPAAANVERYENLVLSPEGLSKYSCDISFIGTTGQDNEFARFYKGKLDAELDGLLNRIAMEQLKYPNKYVVPELIAQYNRRYNTDITQAVYRQSRIELGGERLYRP
ncbi:MAG: DUF3880 domain-containing protein [Firmicutes bacterium]|nr:DUF3880 domain-containing protein [Bacillota bacterium]